MIGILTLSKIRISPILHAPENSAGCQKESADDQDGVSL